MKFVLLATFLFLSVSLNLANVLPLVQKYSTVPANGDLNPYGIAFVPSGFCTSSLTTSNILVANFNNAANVQGLGSTVVKIDTSAPKSTPDVFFTSSAVGLTAAFGVLKSTNQLLVGNVPNLFGNGTVGTGNIQVVDCTGGIVATLTNPAISAPWGIDIYETSSSIVLFVSNLITGTITRVNFGNPPDYANPQYTVMANGYLTRPDPAAFAVGPGDSVYQPTTDTLYVTSEGDNKIYSIAFAGTRASASGTGTVLFANPLYLHGPVGLVFTPEGNLLIASTDAVNSNANFTSILTEITTAGTFVGYTSIDPANGGAFVAAFGTIPTQNMHVLGAVNDNQGLVQLYSQGAIVPCGGANTLRSPLGHLLSFLL